MYLYGYSTQQITDLLTKLGRPTKKGNTTWSSSSVSGKKSYRLFVGKSWVTDICRKISAGQTKKRLAGEYHLNQCSITRYSVYAQAIDYIAAIKPETANQILAGKVRTPMESVMACYGKAEKEVVELLATSRGSMSTKQLASEQEKAVKSTTIKDMPAFHPDAEGNSLALTIPSWISSINRTRTTAKFSLLTSVGRNQLEQELYELQKAAQTMLNALKEVR